MSLHLEMNLKNWGGFQKSALVLKQAQLVEVLILAIFSFSISLPDPPKTDSGA